MPLGMGLTPEFLEFEHHLYNPNFQIGEDKSGDCDYNIQYNEVPMNNEDETYTYLSTTGLSKNIKGDNIKIVGLKDDSKYVSLIDKKGQDIKDAIKVNLNNYSSHPMIVNAFAAKKHNLKIGDQIQVDIKNKANRFDLQLNNATDPTTTQTFKIVGINQTFQNEEYFISQDLANELLGLRNNLNADTNVNN
jgi:hypothetical protein